MKKSMIGRLPVTGIAVIALGAISGAALADQPVTMAPPMGVSTYHVTQDGSGGDSAADDVYQWTAVPQDQQVDIQRGVFDRDGYQLYATTGQTIVIPFTDDNLYVMKFAQTDGDQMYFVNQGGAAPVLYVPRGGYLENATVSGARWYPFSEDFHPSHPVYVGIAPSWSDFIGMGWYPGMYAWGGYWSNRPFSDGGLFLAMAGLFFAIDGHHYYGWHGYHDYYIEHPHDFHVRTFRPGIYARASRDHFTVHSFRSGDHPFTAHNSFARGNNSGQHGFSENRHSFANGQHSFNSGQHTFSNAQHGFSESRGATGGAHGYAEHQHTASAGHQSFGGGGHDTGHGGHGFGGRHNGDHGGHGYGGGGHGGR